MSEWCGLYFTYDTMIIVDFDNVEIGKKDVTSLIDKLEIKYINEGERKYEVRGYKDGKPVELIGAGEKIKNIEYCKSYINDTGELNFQKKPSISYNIELEDN